MDIAASIEAEFYYARSAFEHARFNLVSALSTVEAKKRYEFLEAIGGMMEAHFQYFKQGYELMCRMEPNIKQVLEYAQESREKSHDEQVTLGERMEEYKKQVDQESRCYFNGSHRSKHGDAIQPSLRSSHKEIEAVMKSTAEGKVQTIKQGYLSKRSSNLRGDWKRRFFVLDSRGKLYYYRAQWSKSFGSGTQFSTHKKIHSESGPGLLSRLLSSHYHGAVQDEKSIAHHTVNLLTSTIKADAEQSDLRFCFRIISPTKTYTVQAESAVDQMDWIDKITGVIASLLCSQTPDRLFSYSPTSESSSEGSFSDNDQREGEEHNTDEKYIASRSIMHTSRHSFNLHSSLKFEKAVDALRKLPGNDKCADCGAPEPDWASLNLGVLICIECSGAHRNLGVHISKVRSLTLDVKVWEPSVLTFFQALGNTFVNSVWEAQLQARTFQTDEIPNRYAESCKHNKVFRKPNHDYHISIKEKFIYAKYAEKHFVHKLDHQHLLSVAQQLWDSVRTNDMKAVYHLIVISEADVNTIHGQLSLDTSTLSRIINLVEQENLDTYFDSIDESSSSMNRQSQNEDQSMDNSFGGCSLLHLACQTADCGMVELLLQQGAKLNASDSRGQTPLHQSIVRGRTTIAKLLLSRGANPLVVDKEGKTPVQLIQESTFDDVEILALLKNVSR